jgi:hypothetical protein
MSSLSRRLIHFAGNTVSVEFENPIVGEILDLIIYPFESPGGSQPFATFRLDVSSDLTPIFTLYHDNNQTFESSSRVDTAEMLLSQICHELAVDSRDGLLFHAAGLARNGSGFLLPGGIAAGKSTFTAWMLSRGFDYLTDELVYIPWETNTMVSFARPLHLKKPSRPVLSVLLDYNTADDRLLSGTFSDLVHPSRLAKPAPYSQPPVRHILFPRYQPHGELKWQPLTPAQAGLELMQCLINARNLPDHGFSETARLAREVRSTKIGYSFFSQIEERIDFLSME